MRHNNGVSLIAQSAGAFLLAFFSGGAACASPFATIVIDYTPAPGQFINNASFSAPSRALGPPTGGGTLTADNTDLLTLGGFGGSVTLGFDHRILDDPRNPGGLDAIVFGNATWVAGDPSLRFAEVGVIEISLDVNGNGVADDAWYVIAASHLPSPPLGAPVDVARLQMWDADAGTATPPANISWYPGASRYPSLQGGYSTGTFEAPASIAMAPLDNPNGVSASNEGVWGYADCSPTLLLGDMSGALGGAGDNNLTDPRDRPSISPNIFYTAPDDPFTVGVSSGSGGGDAFDIAWAVDPQTGTPANLVGFDFIRISTAGDALIGPGGLFGELSTEIDAVADVRPASDLSGDGAVNAFDLATLIGAWGTADPVADIDGDGVVGVADLATLIGSWG